MSENSSRKRSAQGDGGSKRGKKGKYFSDKARFHQTLTGIETGTQGIFATCIRGKEPRCVGELYSLFDKYAEKLYGPFEGVEANTNTTKDNDDGGDDDDDDKDEGGDMDIEAMMAKELASMRNTGNPPHNRSADAGTGDEEPPEKKPFISVKLDAQCLVYFRTNPPIDPSSFVHFICTDFTTSLTHHSRFTSRLTPIERTGKATIEGIEEVARHVLKPHFHSGQDGVRFAIRPSLRHHDVLTREAIINTVAKCVGLQHKVDLKTYDVLILVEVYKNMCGMSVVKDWEKLKRYNLEQLQQIAVANKSKPKVNGKGPPPPKPKVAEAEAKKEKETQPKAETEPVQTETAEEPGELALGGRPAGANPGKAPPAGTDTSTETSA